MREADIERRPCILHPFHSYMYTVPNNVKYENNKSVNLVRQGHYFPKKCDSKKILTFGIGNRPCDIGFGWGPRALAPDLKSSLRINHILVLVYLKIYIYSRKTKSARPDRYSDFSSSSVEFSITLFSMRIFRSKLLLGIVSRPKCK